MLLFAALPRGDTIPLAKALLRQFGSLGQLFKAPPAQIQALPGAGPAVAAAIKIVQAAMERSTREGLKDLDIVSSWDELLDYCNTHLRHEKVENFHLLFLNRKNRVIGLEHQQRGTVDHTPVYPREVVKRALELNASALILVHNHPSGDPTPSRADIEMTSRIERAAKAVGIALHDHVIIGKEQDTSFRSQGLLPPAS